MKRSGIILMIGILLSVSGRLFSQTEYGDYLIYHSHNFENNTLGDYQYNEYKADWLYPEWEDRPFPPKIILTDKGDKMSKVMRWDMLEGTVGPWEGGGQWMTDIPNLEEMYFSYKVRLKPGFQWVLGGKLPGIRGGPLHPVDTRPGPNDGWMLLIMWSRTGRPVFYCYHQDQVHMSADSWGWGFTFDTGIWYTLTMRIVMNTVDENGSHYDGIMEGWIDGQKVIGISDMRFRSRADYKIDKLVVNFFFGGSGDEWAPLRDEYVELDDFVAYTYKDNVNIERGNNPTSWERTLVVPDVEDPSTAQTQQIERDSDTTKVKVEAYGDALNGVNAHFLVLVNNEIIGETDATSSTATYEFDLESPPSGNDTVYIFFTNDEYIAGEGDRNLNVKSITYNGYKYYPASNNVVYAFEGSSGININNGSSEMPYTGQLVFFPGETYVNSSLLYPVFEASPMFSNVAPEIANQAFTCIDTLENGTGIGKVMASDSNADQLLSYQILSGNTSGAFDISSSTGTITVANSAYLKNNDQFLLEVMIEDNHPLSKSDTGLVVININHFVPDQIEEDVPPKISVYYIDPSNINDLSEDGSLAHPFDSWSDVNWESGNSYLQKRGTIAYEKKINLGASNITIGAYGEGDLPMIRSQAKDFAMRAYERKNITISDVYLIAEEAISCIYFLGSACDSILINNCVFESSSNGIRIIEGKTFDISYNTFIGCVDAIYSFAENNKIYYNVFKDNKIAINVSSYLSKANIFNNVFYYNSTGISASYSELVIYNNIFYLEEQGNQALNYNFDKLVSDNNIYYPEQEGFLNINNVNYASLEEYQSTTGLDMNSFTQDPQFIDVYNNNFGLKSTSPAIDAGKDVGATLDFFGTSVPYGNAPDIGLKEAQQSRNVTGLTDNIEDMTVSDGPVVYPNPTDGIIQVSYNMSSTADMEIIIRDISGRTVLMDRISGGYSTYQTEIDIAAQPTGVYLVFFNILGKSYLQKVIKN